MEAKSSGRSSSDSKYSQNDSDYKQAKGSGGHSYKMSKQEQEEEDAAEDEWNQALKAPQKGEIKIGSSLEAQKIVEGFKM
jgi:hypothetical protein